jgi:hypothetical protein
VGGRWGDVGMVETTVGVGGRDVEGVLGITLQYHFVGSVFRYMVVAA